MNIDKATEAYEGWLGERAPLVASHLKTKHRKMREHPFPFLRATFYRWAQRWPAVCEDLATAPEAPAVGDLHLENFGTWRDAEGRLAWGVNDFDEACPLPYTNDLVRLATSVKLARSYVPDFDLPFDKGCARIVEGYAKALGSYLEGRPDKKKRYGPVLLAERNEWLSEIAQKRMGDPDDFWAKLAAGRRAKITDIPVEAREAAQMLFPAEPPELDWRWREAGLGSLGRVRVVGLALWQGGRIAREAKALAPSAWTWAHPRHGSETIAYETILGGALRSPDPFSRPVGRWMVRRLAPDCDQIEMDAVPRRREDDLLAAMGRETANVHLGAGNAVLARVWDDLQARKKNWLRKAAERMAEAVEKDWKDWK